VKITLRLKFIILTTVLVTLIMISVTYLFNFREKAAKQSALAGQVNRIARNIATMQLLDRQDWSVYQNYITRLMDFNPDLVYIAVYDDRNALRAYGLNQNLVEINSPNLTRSRQAAIVRRLDLGAIAPESRGDLRTERVNILVGERVLGSVHVGASLIHLNSDLRRGLQINVLLAIFFIGVFSILSVIISRRLTRNVERLKEAIEAVNAGNLKQTVEIRSHDEMAVLGKSFNDMVAGLRERQIIEKLGHELSATIQMEKLGPLIRNRLRNALGAHSVRMFIKMDGDRNILHEFVDENDPVPGRGCKSIPLRDEIVSRLKGREEYFPIESLPPTMRKTLHIAGSHLGGIVLPLLLNEEIFGIFIFLLPPEREQFSERQINFALTLANPAAIALENAILYRGLREQERMKRELEIARDVQKKLLPNRMPELDGFAIDGVCIPAREVSGDYFDFFRLDETHLGIAVADVSGKGTSASFYMAEIKGMMLTLTTVYRSPRELLIALNRKLYGSLDQHSFVTMLFGILDTETNSFTFARAGHTPLISIGRNGAAKWLTPPGLGVGLERGILFEKFLAEEKISIRPGERLIFFTDGLVEAMDGQREEYGEERLLNVILDSRDPDISATREKIIASVEKFTAGAPVHDDITLVILQKLEGEKVRPPEEILQKTAGG